jgi:membrane protein required for colicin V production
MEGFTIVDGVVAVVVVVSAILAFSRGFLRETLAIAGWIGAAVVAYIFAPNVAPLVSEVPYLGDFLGGSCELQIVAGFAVVFAVALIVFAIFTPLFSSAVRRSSLNGVDQGLGFLFGVVRGLLLVALAFVVYERAMGNTGVQMINDSRSAAVFAQVTQSINEYIPSDVPEWLVQGYDDLFRSCTQP